MRERDEMIRKDEKIKLSKTQPASVVTVGAQSKYFVRKYKHFAVVLFCFFVPLFCQLVWVDSTYYIKSKRLEL